MLSKYDILKELGKGISIFPLKECNIKENSINLSASKFSWATTSCDIYIDEDEVDKNKKFSLTQDETHNKKISIVKNNSAVIKDCKNEYIILLPLSTTLIETQEVLSTNSYIGGTYHSKVGMVSKGLGHIGTMVGPNFSGDSLIAVHNTSQNLIVIKVGETFVSVVFHYLNTSYEPINPTISGHTEKFAELGLKVSEDDLVILNEDWKKRFEEVSYKMCQSDDYVRLQKKLKEQQNKKIKKYFCKKNIFVSIFAIILLVGLFIVAQVVDNHSGNTLWTDRYINVGCSGIIIVIISNIIKYIKYNANKWVYNPT